jgi:hypothetical protein
LRCLLSRRRHEEKAEESDAPALARRGDLFRRVLLGAVTALIVARPLVAGEDPGRLRSPESVSGIFLNMLWITTALAGALWLARSRRQARLGGWVPLALHVTTAVVILAALIVPCYRHPGWLMTWECATLAISFLLVRALAADVEPADDSPGGLLAAVMASVVSLAVYGIYQTIAMKTGLPVPEVALEGVSAAPPGADFAGPVAPAARTGDFVCRGPFHQPDTLIALLLLVLPALVVFAITGRDLRQRIGRALLLLPVGALVLATMDYVRSGSAERVLPGIATAWRMFADNVILGVGPGNFDRYAARYQPPELPMLLTDGGSMYADTLAAGGMVFLVGVVALFGLIFAHSRRAVSEDPPAPADDRLENEGPRWEFYLGGVIGLLLGLVLRLADHPGAAPAQLILQIGVGAVIRAVVWFLAFALFEGTAWRFAGRRRAIVIGITLLAVFGLLSTAPLRPAVLQPMIVLAALAMTRQAVEPVVAPSRLRWLPVPVMFVVAIVYFFLVCQPIYLSANGVTEARRAARHYPDLYNRYEGDPIRSSDYIGRTILNPLAEAQRADPYDVAPMLEWLGWYHEYWKLRPEWPQEHGLSGAAKAEERDPQGTGALIAELQLRLTYARLDPRHFRPKAGLPFNPNEISRNVEEWRGTQLRESESLIERIAARDPALEPRLRFRLAQALISLSDPKRRDEGKAMAKRVYQKAEGERRPRWQLTSEQRYGLRRWLGLPPESGERQFWLVLPLAAGPVIAPVVLNVP